MYKLGIIPAAGKSTRFGGILKELLPLPNGNSFLREAVNRTEMFCDRTVVISQPEKIAQHALELGSRVIYAVQEGENDIWSAIRTAICIPADTYMFTMPDTYLDRRTFALYKGSDFAMGLFTTHTPERFGCLVDGIVINKKSVLTTPVHAWGVLAWSKKVAEFWKACLFTDYTVAINAAIDQFGVETWKIASYFDNASVNDYGELWLE
ncbi:MAG TPA: nucleotidyltransferase family protein [Anaerolineales bacterium]|nr:nucleotidyltransferase family protein [Anaerolineales bacterium]